MRFEDLRQVMQQMIEWASTVGDGEALALAEFDHAVVLARVDQKEVEWAPSAPTLSVENLLDLRLFGPAGEWHLWRIPDDEEFLARFRGDADGECYDELQALWGTAAKPIDGHPGWSELLEERGISYEVPKSVAGDTRGRGALRLRVRHYLGYEDDTGLAGVIDSRLVGLEREV